MIPFTLTAAFKRFFRFGYQPAPVDPVEAIQDRIHHALTKRSLNLRAYHNHLRWASLNFTTKTSEAEKEAFRDEVKAQIINLEKGRLTYWLDYWLVYIDDDASDLEAPLKTREDVLAAVRSGKARYHTLSDDNRMLKMMCDDEDYNLRTVDYPRFVHDLGLNLPHLERLEPLGPGAV